MKAAVFDDFGGPEVIAVSDIAQGLLTDTSVRVRVAAVSVNHVDTLHINGFVISHASEDQLTRASHVLNDAFTAGHLLADSILQMPLSQAALAHTMVETGEQHRSRIALMMG